MEFELDDYRSGRINKKVRNLNCINSTGYNNTNENKYKKKKIENKSENIANKNNNNDKAIYVNSKNNNYLITKLKKENESLRLIVSEYESNIVKYKINEKKIRQKKIENEMRITRKSTNVKPQQSLIKSSNNFSNFCNNTFTTNFYHPKNSKQFNTNNNSLINNTNNKINDSQTGAKVLSVNSYIVHNKKIVKNKSKKSLSVFRSSSKGKPKNMKNKTIYDKVKTNYKKINNNPNSNVFDNNIINKKQEINNNSNNKRVHTLNNNMNNSNYISSKNVFTYKKKVNHNCEPIQNNLCNTERKNTDANNSNLNSNNENIQNNNLNRNTVFIPKAEFNLTWSRFPKKGIENSFENIMNDKNPPQSVILTSKNTKKIQNNKYITKVSSKNKYSVDKFDNSNIKENKDITPQKITINRRVITNKIKNNKNFFGSNNVSMKNIINIQQKNKRNGFDENKNINQNSINASASNKMMNINNNFWNEGQIYTHKKKNSMYGIESKNINNDSLGNNIIKKNNIMNNKYNVTINNINNCNYYNLIQNKP